MVADSAAAPASPEPRNPSKADFARMVGVTRAAISIALRKGRLTAEADGSIDPRRPENAAYLATSKRQRRRAGSPPGESKELKPPTSPRPPVQPASNGAESPQGEGPAEIDGETYTMAELRKLRAQADKEELNNAAKRGDLIERKLVHRFLSRVYVVDTSELRPLGDRISSTLVGIVRSAESDELATTRVNEKITEEVFHSLEHIKVLLDKFIAEGLPENGEAEDAED